MVITISRFHFKIKGIPFQTGLTKPIQGIPIRQPLLRIVDRDFKSADYKYGIKHSPDCGKSWRRYFKAAHTCCGFINQYKINIYCLWCSFEHSKLAVVDSVSHRQGGVLVKVFSFCFFLVMNSVKNIIFLIVQNVVFIIKGFFFGFDAIDFWWVGYSKAQYMYDINSQCFDLK